MLRISPKPGRPRFLHGTRQIVEFNWPRFAASGAIIAGGLFLVMLLPSGPLATAIMTGVFLAAWWTVASLVASWWIYDLSALTTWRWLPQVIGWPGRWTNVHAGFDETTDKLKAVFSTSEGSTVDIYDPVLTPEASIARARRRTKSDLPSRLGSCNHLPLDAQSQDAIFLLFAAHELRKPDQRVALFREAARVMRPDGIVVLVEHLRDAANFVVFGPGAFHFLPHRAWLHAVTKAGLRVRDERRLGPFVALLVLEMST